MLRLAAAFVVLALIAGLFGFGSVLDISWHGARVLFFIFAALAVLSLVGGAYRMRALLN